jgi:hypothetical protein
MSASEHESRDLAHEALCLGQRDDGLGANALSVFVGPARQSFSAHDAMAAQFHDRLVGDRKLPKEDGALELAGVAASLFGLP